MHVLTMANMATLAVCWHVRAVPLIEELPAEPVGRSPVSLPMAARKATLDILLDTGTFLSPPPTIEAIQELAERIQTLMHTYHLKQAEARIELLTLQTEIARSGSQVVGRQLQFSIQGVRILDEVLDSLQTVTHLCCQRLSCIDDGLPHEQHKGLSSPELRHLLRSPLQAALSNTEFLIEKSQHNRVSDLDLQDIVQCIREAALILANRLS